MTTKVIQFYIDKLRYLRDNPQEIKNYEFKLSEDRKADVNRFNRYAIGVGLFNDLKVPEDYSIVKKLLDEELKHRKSNTDDYEYETIYMYYYFVSEFGRIEDIWDFAALKFDGTMDADAGFETNFFLTYGMEKLRQYLSNSNHDLKVKIEQKIFANEKYYSDLTGDNYKKSQIDYFDFKRPIKDPMNFYLRLEEKEYLLLEFENWKNTTDLSNPKNIYRYVIFAKFAGLENEIKQAMENYIAIAPDDYSSKIYRKYLGIKKEGIIQRIFSWFS